MELLDLPAAAWTTLLLGCQPNRRYAVTVACSASPPAAAGWGLPSAALLATTAPARPAGLWVKSASNLTTAIRVDWLPPPLPLGGGEADAAALLEGGSAAAAAVVGNVSITGYRLTYTWRPAGQTTSLISGQKLCPGVRTWCGVSGLSAGIEVRFPQTLNPQTPKP